MKIASIVVVLAALTTGQGSQSPDTQSDAAPRNVVTRLNAQVQTLQQQLTALNSSTTTRLTGLLTALVPIGAVIDWNRPRPDTALPNGFMICNGDLITDALSPLRGTKTPNLNDEFVMGVTTGRLGETGGRADIPTDGAHSHGEKTAQPRSGEGGKKDAFKSGGDRGCCPQVTGLDHFHAIASDGARNHGGESRTPYYGLINLICIK